MRTCLPGKTSTTGSSLYSRFASSVFCSGEIDFTAMMFDKAPWTVKISYVPQKYGYIDNLVTKCTAAGQCTGHYIEVPTELFVLLEQILSPSEMCMAKQNARLYLDEVDSRHWMFGIAIGEDAFELIDLWPYTTGSLPPCFSGGGFRVKRLPWQG